jgi:hypothetical protein
MVAAQILFYAVAALDLLLGPASLVKRVSSPAWTVVSMLFATACAVMIFFVPPQQLWKPTRVRVAGKE